MSEGIRTLTLHKTIYQLIYTHIRVIGIEPILFAWKANDLPINLYSTMGLAGIEPTTDPL